MSGSIGFVGAGAMAAAIIRGVAEHPRFTSIRFCDPNREALATCERRAGSKNGGSCSIKELCSTCNVIVLAVKPQVAPSVLRTLSEFLSDQHLLISIMAGVALSTLRELSGGKTRLIRVMPNAPLLVRRGAAALAAEPSTPQGDIDLVETIFSRLGYCATVPEHLLNAVTGVSGSGPAYVAVIIEALADGGVQQGLPRRLALDLAAHTVAGAATMVAEGNDGAPLHPALLKDMVCSPGGTSIAGLAAMEAGATRSSLMNAVRATTQRAEELGKSKL